MGTEGALTKISNSGRIPSLILWGPPGVGKTTIAELLAKKAGISYLSISAVHSGASDLKKIAENARRSGGSLLFVDEIHRFNKAQQDALLQSVERGWITLVGATTENPSFEINSALLSRCQVLVLHALSREALIAIAQVALEKDEYISSKNIELKEFDALLDASAADGRKLLNNLEYIISLVPEKSSLDNESIASLLGRSHLKYDKKGDKHYDTISAFIKSIRGSDPNAAIYYLAVMLEAGEELSFIARRLQISASEDIGLANPTALVMANSAYEAVLKVGMPEARIILSQITVYLATSPKSNSIYTAINEAMNFVRKNPYLDVPVALRNTPTQFMKDQNFGKDYQYSHLGENNFIKQNFLPEPIKGKKFFEPANNDREKALRNWLKRLWGDSYNY